MGKARRSGLLGLICVLCAAGCQVPSEPTPAGQRQVLPGVWLNRKARYVDVEGRIVLRQGMLELVACQRLGREHESIVALDARASHVHQGLLMLGLDEGEPGKWVAQDDGQYQAVDPTGDAVMVSLIVEEDGQPVEHPISRFVKNRQTGEPLPTRPFIFAGSRMAEFDPPRTVYAADVEGNIVSLVTFGDDVLAWEKAASTSNEMVQWEAKPETLPSIKTPVRLRLRPADDKPQREGTGG